MQKFYNIVIQQCFNTQTTDFAFRTVNRLCRRGVGERLEEFSRTLNNYSHAGRAGYKLRFCHTAYENALKCSISMGKNQNVCREKTTSNVPVKAATDVDTSRTTRAAQNTVCRVEHIFTSLHKTSYQPRYTCVWGMINYPVGLQYSATQYIYIQI